MSNNVAEYSGIIAFLEWYTEHKRTNKVNIYSDSELLVNQMTGVYRAKKGLYLPYHKKAVTLIDEVGRSRFHFEWIPREDNTEADELSEQALLDMVTE